MPPLLTALPLRAVTPRRAQALLDYIMVCCQVQFGGLRDKPGRGRDYYHTCYCLSGLAVAAAEPSNAESSNTEPSVAPDAWKAAVGIVHPVYNVVAPKAEAALAHFSALPKLPARPAGAPPIPTPPPGGTSWQPPSST